MAKLVAELIALVREWSASAVCRVVLTGIACVLLLQADAIKAALHVDGLTVLVEFVEPVAWIIFLGVGFVFARDVHSAWIRGLPENQLRDMRRDAGDLQRSMDIFWDPGSLADASLYVKLVAMKKRLSKLGIASPEIARNREEWFNFLVRLQVWAVDGDIDAARRQR